MQHSNCQYQTVQQYISMLFDELQPVPIDPRDNSQIVLLQLTNYGRKIIQLSQQSTFKYRHQHFVQRNEIQHEIGVIYRLVTGQQPLGGYEKNIKQISDKLQWDKKSIWGRPSLPQSRLITPFQPKSQQQGLKQVLQEQRNTMKPSRVKSKQTNSKNNTVKEVLQVKGCFQDQQTCIRQIFDKVNKYLDINKVQVSSFEPQNLRFTRVKTENNSEKIVDLIKTTTQSHSKNLSSLNKLIELLYDSMNKRLKNQGAANSKIQAYFDEVKRMEEVYSYTISKILENISSVKNLIKDDPSLCLRHIVSLQEITEKLYQLYPTSQYFQSISVSSRGIKESISYGTQVNMNKMLVEKKAGSETYRLQVRLSEMLDKFDKNMKFRKAVEIKEVQKLFEALRQALPSTKNTTSQDISYQEEFKKLVDLQEKREKQTTEYLTKKCKKMEKKVQELQQVNEEQKKEISVIVEQWDHEKKKWNKKLDHEHSEYKKIKNEKSHLESNISQMLKEIDGMRAAVKRQGNQEALLRIQLQKEREDLQQRSEQTAKKLTKNIEDLRIEKQRIFEERSIYRQKIELTQKQLQQQRQLSTGLKLELETVIEQHHNLRMQLGEMTIIYQQKIKQVEEMIGNLRQLQDIKTAQDKRITEIMKEVEEGKFNIQQQAKDISKYLSTIDQLVKENNDLKIDLSHWNQQGKLTDSDLRTLKEEVDKVNTAYIQSEAVVQSTRKELSHVIEEREKLFKQKLKMNRLIEDLEGQLQAIKTRHQALQLSERDMKDQFYQKCQEIAKISRQIEESKRQLNKYRIQLNEERDSRAISEKEHRELRQNVQSKRELESAEQGKRRLQLQNIRVELRKKTEQVQKQRESYEQKINIMTQRIREMEQSAGQKQLLSRLLQHQSQ